MADAADLKSAGVVPRVGSNPTRPIGPSLSKYWGGFVIPGGYVRELTPLANSSIMTQARAWPALQCRSQDGVTLGGIP